MKRFKTIEIKSAQDRYGRNRCNKTEFESIITN